MTARRSKGSAAGSRPRKGRQGTPDAPPVDAATADVPHADAAPHADAPPQAAHQPDAPDTAALALAARQPPVFIGTSGFSYTEWRGNFYPEKLPAKSFLRWYSQCFPTTEINNTFHRIPRPQLTAQWRAEVPDDFRFTLKLSQRITHIKRLQNVDTEMSWFANGALELGPTLGPVLVQLPPNFKKDAARLGAFFAKQASRLQLAVEFRHASWLDGEIESLLRAHGVAFAVVETEPDDTLPRPRLVTGPFVYVRLRKADYAPAELRDWAAWIRTQTTPVYVYVKHDVAAPAVARALVAALAESSS